MFELLNRPAALATRGPSAKVAPEQVHSTDLLAKMRDHHLNQVLAGNKRLESPAVAELRESLRAA